MKTIDRINRELLSNKNFRKQLNEIGRIGHEKKTLVSNSARRN